MYFGTTQIIGTPSSCLVDVSLKGNFPYEFFPFQPVWNKWDPYIICTRENIHSTLARIQEGERRQLIMIAFEEKK